MSVIVSTLPILGKVTIPFYGLSEKIYDIYTSTNEFERQKSIKHLGLISTVFDGASHSRFEYVLLQCAITDLVDALHKGDPNSALGEIKLNGISEKGNSLIKSWFLLSNYGHLKNTIGDEKTLLLRCHEDSGFKKFLLRPIKDDELKKFCSSIISNFNYTSFHYVIAARRIYFRIRKNKTLRDNLIEILKILLLEKSNLTFNADKAHQLRQAFNLIRYLSIISIDSHYSHTPLHINLIQAIINAPQYENIYKSYSSISALKSIFRIISDQLYLDPAVLAAQRSYEVDSLKSIKSTKKHKDILIGAIHEGIKTPAIGRFGHLARLKLPQSIMKNKSLYDLQKEFCRMTDGIKSVEFSADINSISKRRYIDVLYDPDIMTKQCIANTYIILTNKIREFILDQIYSESANIFSISNETIELLEGSEIDDDILNKAQERAFNLAARNTYPSFKKETIPLYSELLWSLLRYCLNKNYSFDIQHKANSKWGFGLYVPDHGINLLTVAIEENKKGLTDKDRIHEIAFIEKQTKTKRDFIFTCLDRILIFNPELPPEKRKVTDIDGAILRVTETKVILELLEAKNLSKKSRREIQAKKELKEKLAPSLNARKRFNYRIKGVKDFGASLQISFKVN